MAKVYLVGAGPGAPDLLTLRAARLLAEADVVFTDALVHPDTLALATRASIVHVGKRAGEVSTEQRFINRALVAAAKRYRCVVIEALREAGIDYEVVPGVSAAFAAAASLGASLTQRGISRSVSFVTPRVGHGEQADDAWLDAISRGGTAALYMAAGQAEVIAAALIGHGIAGATPCAIVVNASLPDEHIAYADVAHLPQIAATIPPGPALVIVGEVVSAGDGLRIAATAADEAPSQRRAR